MILICTILIILYLLISFFAVSSRSIPYGLSLDTTKALKGILVLVVISSHLIKYLECGLLLKELENYGALAVSTFFFISGYGLFKSIQTKANYLNNFIKHRFYKLLPPIVIVTCIFIFLNITLEHLYSIHIYNFYTGKTLTPYSWYIYVTIIYYIIFYFTFKLIKNHIKAIITIYIFIIAYILILKSIHWEQYWYISSLCFPLGLLYGYQEQRIIKLLYKKLISTFIFYAFNIAILLYCSLGTYFSWFGWGTIMYNLIPLFIIPILYRLNLGKSTVLKFLGNISYELYIVHGIFICLGKPFLKGPFLVILVCIFSLISAYYLHKVCVLLNSKIS